MSKSSPASGRTRARRALLQALYQWLMTGESPDEIESQFVTERPMEHVDIEYFHSLLHAIPDHVAALDETLSPNLDRPLSQLDPIEHTILRIGSFELVHQKDVPMRVVINEAIELAKLFGADQSHKYINSILDRVAKTERVNGL